MQATMLLFSFKMITFFQSYGNTCKYEVVDQKVARMMQWDQVFCASTANLLIDWESNK